MSCSGDKKKIKIRRLKSWQVFSQDVAHFTDCKAHLDNVIMILGYKNKNWFDIQGIKKSKLYDKK